MAMAKLVRGKLKAALAQRRPALVLPEATACGMEPARARRASPPSAGTSAPDGGGRTVIRDQ